MSRNELKSIEKKSLNIDAETHRSIKKYSAETGKEMYESIAQAWVDFLRHSNGGAPAASSANDSGSIDRQVEWLLESIRIGTSAELLRVMNEDGRVGLASELLLAIDEWTDPSSDGTRGQDKVAQVFYPDEKDFKKKVDVILGSGDMKSVMALGATVDLIYERLEPVTARRKSGS